MGFVWENTDPIFPGLSWDRLLVIGSAAFEYHLPGGFLAVPVDPTYVPVCFRREPGDRRRRRKTCKQQWPPRRAGAIVRSAEWG